MPSKKPRLQAILDSEIHEKFKAICDNEKRSESQMASIIIAEYIKKYESQNGTINIKNINMIDNKGTINM